MILANTHTFYFLPITSKTPARDGAGVYQPHLSVKTAGFSTLLYTGCRASQGLSLRHS